MTAALTLARPAPSSMSVAVTVGAYAIVPPRLRTAAGLRPVPRVMPDAA